MCGCSCALQYCACPCGIPVVCMHAHRRTVLMRLLVSTSLQVAHPQRPAHPYGFSQPLFQCSPRVSGFPLGCCAQPVFGVPLWHTCMLRVARLCYLSVFLNLSQAAGSCS
jgi:hypothetical protein